MKKKRFNLALSFATICGGVWAQEQSPLLWPIKGQEAGTNILLRPQDLLDHETNYGTLVIGAKEGMEVIAPADGEVSSINLTYFSSLNSCRGYHFDDETTADGMRRKVLCTLGERMFVRVVQPGYEQYLGKEVATIDGIPVKEQAAYVRSQTNLFDAQVQSTGAVQMLTNWSIQYRDNNCDKPAHLTFTDGSCVEVPFLKPNQVKKFIPQATAPIAYNVHRSQNLREDWSFKLLDDNMALLTLAHFHMNDVQMDAIADSLRSHANVPNLIVDVRDNPGGDAGCEAKMVQWFLTESGPSNLTYQKVMSNTIYPCFTHCYNWPAAMQPFEKFVKVDGMEGFYNRDISSELKTAQHQKKHSSKKKKAKPQQTNAIYKGKLYILTNENSASAATDFPAHLVRAGRAVTIGRETATAYHYMTALKFAHLFLPNSHIEYQLPLIKAVTASDVSERFPYGRGLLPDYEVPLTREEIFSSTEDVILNRAKEIIQQNNNQK